MATDKRLSQVSTLTDFDYALIVKGDQVAKASKQQLAELVGNLLYGATNASSLATVVAGYNKIKYKESSSAGNILEKRTMGFIFAYNTDNMEYYIGSYNNGTEQTPSHQKISGNLDISWFNQFGSFTIEGANKFIIIYIDK